MKAPFKTPVKWDGRYLIADDGEIALGPLPGHAPGRQRSSPHHDGETVKKAFIVHAINHHEALVAALTETLSGLEALADYTFDASGGYLYRATQLCLQTLTNLEAK